MDATGKTAEPPQLPPQAASAAQISAVLGNDDLLGEILLRLDFPTCLVRAAAVSKRWLRHASDPAFLHRFRRLHPPRLLGFYVVSCEPRFLGLHIDIRRPRFIPLPQPPELAAVIRRGNFDLGRDVRGLSDCRNGRLIVSIKPDDQRDYTTVCRPLHPGRVATALPLPETLSLADDENVDIYSDEFLFHDDGGDDMLTDPFSVVAVLCIQGQTRVRLFQAGDWGKRQNSDLIQLPGPWMMCEHLALVSNGNIFMMCMAQYILVLDVQSMSLFSIKLPNGVEYVKYCANIALSRAEGSGFCLVHVKMFQISVWHYTMDYSSTGNWELVDTISLPQVFGPSADPTWCSQGADVQVVVVGDNADFVFLRILKEVFYLHISSRTVEKVYELARRESLDGIYPFMMVWPPTFPTLNGGHDNDE